ncbi:MAG: hypothetical protein QXN31_06030 [Desulfurococcus sp.]
MNHSVVRYIALAVLVIVLTLLINTISLIGITLYSIATHSTPSLLVNVEKSGNATIFEATPLLIIISAAIASTITYGIAQRTSRKLYIPVVIVVLIIIVIAIFGILAACGIACPYFTCGGRGVEYCDMQVGWVYVKYICDCA